MPMSTCIYYGETSKETLWRNTEDCVLPRNGEIIRIKAGMFVVDKIVHDYVNDFIGVFCEKVEK